MRGLKKFFSALTFLTAMTTIGVADETHWSCGAWDCRGWGAIRVFPDGITIDTDPEGYLNDYGYWQNYCGPDSIIIVWMESSRVEIIERHNGKYYRQLSYSFGIGSNIEETKKIGK
jgi:hypothetical protein